MDAIRDALDLETIQPLDQRREAERALASGVEAVVYHWSDAGRHYTYFPASGVGAVADNGDSVWAQVSGPDDMPTL